MTTTDTTRTRADRVQQLAAFLAKHPEVDVDVADRTGHGGRPVLSFTPETAEDVSTLLTALTEPGDKWDTQSLAASGFVTLESGALGYSMVFIHLPRAERPVAVVSPEIVELFA